MFFTLFCFSLVYFDVFFIQRFSSSASFPTLPSPDQHQFVRRVFPHSLCSWRLSILDLFSWLIINDLELYVQFIIGTLNSKFYISILIEIYRKSITSYSIALDVQYGV
jgi:hypothetical protein